MAYEFEWDAIKAATNLRDHGVSFEEVSTVFADPLAMLLVDPITPSTKSGTCCWENRPGVISWSSPLLSGPEHPPDQRQKGDAS